MQAGQRPHYLHPGEGRGPIGKAHAITSAPAPPCFPAKAETQPGLPPSRENKEAGADLE